MKQKIEIKPVINNDNKKTPEQLIIDNENFVYSIVNNQFKKYPWNVKEELYSAGKLGLAVAAHKFNPKDYTNKFISYAVFWIRYYINEEIRKLYPVKLDQNFIYKRNKLNKAILKYKKEHDGKEPNDEYLMKELKISQKVLNGIRKINGGNNFSFVSFQAVSENANNDNDENTIENSLVNEYLETSDDSTEQMKYEIKDLLETLKKHISERDYNIFYDLRINGLSTSAVKEKYGLNFPSSATCIIKRAEKKCRELLNI